MVRTGGGMFRPRRGTVPNGAESSGEEGDRLPFSGNRSRNGESASVAPTERSRRWGNVPSVLGNVPALWMEHSSFLGNVPAVSVERSYDWGNAPSLWLDRSSFWGVFRLFRWDIRPIGRTFPRKVGTFSLLGERSPLQDQSHPWTAGEIPRPRARSASN